MVYVIFLCIALPLGLMLPILERRSRRLVFFLLLGMTTALVAYEVDTILYSLCGLDTVRFTQTVPPIVEEILKALPVLVFALFFSNDRKVILPVAMSVGIGFSILENTTILVQNLASVTLAGGAAGSVRQSDARSVYDGRWRGPTLCEKAEKAVLDRHFRSVVHRRDHARHIQPADPIEIQLVGRLPAYGAVRPALLGQAPRTAEAAVPVLLKLNIRQRTRPDMECSI